MKIKTTGYLHDSTKCNVNAVILAMVFKNKTIHFCEKCEKVITVR